MIFCLEDIAQVARKAEVVETVFALESPRKYDLAVGLHGYIADLGTAEHFGRGEVRDDPPVTVEGGLAVFGGGEQHS